MGMQIEIKTKLNKKQHITLHKLGRGAMAVDIDIINLNHSNKNTKTNKTGLNQS